MCPTPIQCILGSRERTDGFVETVHLGLKCLAMPCTNGVHLEKLVERLEVVRQCRSMVTIDGESGLTLVGPVGAFVSRCYGQPRLIRG